MICVRDVKTYVSGAVRLPQTLRMTPNLYNGFELSARVYVKSLRQRRLLTDRTTLPLIGQAASEPSAYIRPGTSARTSRGPGSLGGWPLKWGARRISKNAERLTDHSRISREKICSPGAHRTGRIPAFDWFLGGFSGDKEG